MANLNATELASRLGLSKPRISQYVSEGKLEGCYEGEGRARRFDLAKVADALGRKLDLGQMTGNGRATRRTLRAVSDEETTDEQPEAQASRPPIRGYDGPVGDRDPDRLELATLQIKEEQARKARRDNARD
ncbi:hypothetical protein JI664_23530, partial [Rhodobacter sp. NTK016B]|nr:hypothetical protein [Rhodobacter sp. NTK016B]